MMASWKGVLKHDACIGVCLKILQLASPLCRPVNSVTSQGPDIAIASVINRDAADRNRPHAKLGDTRRRRACR